MAAWLAQFNGAVWGGATMGLLLGAGVFLSFICGWPQFTQLRRMLRMAFGRTGKQTENGVSPFQAMCTALAASLGTGNIAGVAGAIALGGPGAVFWMWVSALLGMCTKYAEVALAVHYRERNRKGEWVGGPMYYIKNGLGSRWQWLGGGFALFGALAAFGIGNIAQVHTISSAVCAAAARFTDTAAVRKLPLLVGGVCAGAALAALLGGAKRIGAVCARLIPALALLYTGASLYVIFHHSRALPAVFAAIVKGAFHPQAILGGGAGISMRAAVSQGVSRGVFSNEAGLGSAPLAHASAEGVSPAEQGLYGMLEVFVDTILICTMTALVILLGVGVDAIDYARPAGAELAVQGFASSFGSTLSAAIVAGSLALFALPTILTWGLYGSRCVEFLLGERAAGIYRILFSLSALVGGVMKLDVVWLVSGILNGLMAIPNLTALIALAPVAGKLAKNHKNI